MKIKKEGENLIVEIPLWQTSYDAIDEESGKVPNLVGVIVKSYLDDSGELEQGIYQMIDMDYKGKSPQLGCPIVMTTMEDEDFRKLCNELGLDIWEFSKCAKCNETIWGTHTIDERGQEICLEHLDKNK